MAINSLQDAANAIQQLESEVNKTFDSFDKRIDSLKNRQSVLVIGGTGQENRAFMKGFDPSPRGFPFAIGGEPYDDAQLREELEKHGSSLKELWERVQSIDYEKLVEGFEDLQKELTEMRDSLGDFSNDKLKEKLQELEDGILELKANPYDDSELWEEIDKLREDIADLRENLGSYNTDELKEAFDRLVNECSWMWRELLDLQEKVNRGGIERDVLIRQIEIVLAGKRGITVINGYATDIKDVRINAAYEEDIVTLTAEWGAETIPLEDDGKCCDCEWEIDEEL